MDIPTIVITISFLLIIVAVITNFIFWKFKKSSLLSLGSLTIFICVIYSIVTFLGEFYPGWATTQTCYRFLGCNVGFGGYDAVEHFLFGIVLSLFIIWLSRKYTHLGFKGEPVWRSILCIISFVALVSVCWEFYECAYDAFRQNILHEVLFNFRLHIDLLDQPSNIDTMGDLFYDILGAVVGCFWYRLD